MTCSVHTSTAASATYVSRDRPRLEGVRFNRQPLVPRPGQHNAKVLAEPGRGAGPIAELARLGMITEHQPPRHRGAAA